jgi:choline-sulfatase
MKSFSSLAVLTLILASTFPAAAEQVRPNVLWICADDLAPYAIGSYGGRGAQTPHMDQLARLGVRLDRAYCNSPVCTASRQSFLTGMYPRTLGVTALRTPLPGSAVTLAEVLADAGYETAAFGKMHFNSEFKHGFQTRLDLKDHQKQLVGRPAPALPKDVAVLPAWKPFKDPASIWLNSACLPVGARESDMPGTYFAQEASRFLLGEHRRPFFLMVSFYEPHSPFHFPLEYRGRHKPEEFAVPPLGKDDHQQIPAIFKDLTDREKQGIAAAYHTSVEFLDANVGRVLTALKRANLEVNTLVVFTGDHGYLLGHHGRFEKHCCFEQAVRSPLIISYPQRFPQGQSTEALVEFIDIAPTILSVCGVAQPRSMQGRDLTPLLTGKTSTHRGHVFVEYAENEEAMVRTPQWKLIYTTGARQREDGYATALPLMGRKVRLYDLQADPEELNNLADLPEYAARVEELTRLLADHLVRTARRPELIPRTSDVHLLLSHCLKPDDVTGP